MPNSLWGFTCLVQISNDHPLDSYTIRGCWEVRINEKLQYSPYDNRYLRGDQPVSYLCGSIYPSKRGLERIHEESTIAGSNLGRDILSEDAEQSRVKNCSSVHIICIIRPHHGLCLSSSSKARPKTAALLHYVMYSAQS